MTDLIRYITSYRGDDGALFQDHVDAVDAEHAQQLCDDRGKGETVDGELHLTVQASEHFGHKDADRVTRMFAKTDGPPPLSTEFEI